MIQRPWAVSLKLLTPVAKNGLGGASETAVGGSSGAADPAGMGHPEPG